jgi:uncharacterized membrane protein YczE
MSGKPLQLIKKATLFVAGIFIMAIGVSFSVKSNLGVSPVTSVPYALSRIFPLSLGFWTVLFYLFCMMQQALILRREYRIVNLFQIAASFAFGFFTDLTTRLVSLLPVSENYIVRSVYLMTGIVCVALGILFYLTTTLISLPTDGTVQAIAANGRFKLHHVKIAYDCVSTALALALSLVALGTIDGIGVGTVVAAVGVGRLLGWFSALFGSRLRSFLDAGTTIHRRHKPKAA